MRWFALALLSFVLLPSSAVAQDAAATHAAMRKSLAYIEVVGQKSNGVPLETSGTGVFIDELGHVLTVLHLVTKNESAALDNKLDIWVREGDRHSVRRPAEVVLRDEARDLLVLRVPTKVDPYEAACFGTGIPRLPEIDDRLLTSGFPLDIPYYTGSGRVTSKDGPKSQFGVNIPISSGQSGSPVYDTQGNMLGIMTGSFEGRGISGQHYFRPSRFFWDIVQSFGCSSDTTEKNSNLNRYMGVWVYGKENRGAFVLQLLNPQTNEGTIVGYAYNPETKVLQNKFFEGVWKFDLETETATVRWNGDVDNPLKYRVELASERNALVSAVTGGAFFRKGDVWKFTKLVR